LTSKVFINDNIYAAKDAAISILDRGYLFSDGIYELIPYFNKKSFLFNEHYLRLEKSLKSIDLENPFNKKIWLNKINSFIKECKYNNFALYIQVTRGVPLNISDGILREHAATKEYKSTVCMFCSEIKELSKESPRIQSAITAEDKRWLKCDIKSIALLFNAHTKSMAYKKGAYEAILSRDDVVTEGCSSNVFIIQNKIIKTSPKSNLILPGVTRDFIIEKILHKQQYKILETEFSKKELFKADEVFITNSTQGIMSIGKIDNQVISNGKPGEITTQIYKNFIDYLK
tara:strand:- start:1 stop:861 length:861 start_codon:yes stop_codon:yes gene_type:complete